ncbi:MAG TPA: hypothetical protein VNS09_14845 [Solirubrobacter sp.]|nr:hypothetical protein [Solirubrobacter sp.]
MRIALVTAALVAAFPATAAAELTPDGPATLTSVSTAISTSEGRPPAVLVAVRADVGTGGQAGTVRFRAANPQTALTGDPVTLPAEPGSYTFPAPHIAWDSRTGSLGIEQTTGGHALIAREACQPELGRWADPCQLQSVKVLRPDGTSESDDGARLTLVGLYEPDIDQDLAGDQTEDRTDLRVTAKRETNGAVTVTITNAGPRSADLPAAATTAPGARWEGCAKRAVWPWLPDCALDPIAPGASRTVTLFAAAAGTVTVGAEGPDLVAADNVAEIAAPPALALTAASKQSLRRGVKVRVSAVQAGRVRLTLKLGKARVSRTVALEAFSERTVTLRPTGPKLRSLLRRAPGKATITVAAGGKTAKVKAALRR